MRETWRRHPLYGDILRICEAVIEGGWCRETASPGCQKDWTYRNPAYGQCAVTTLLLEDVLSDDFGIACEILRAEVPKFGSHYWVRLPDGTEVDMTRDQFPPGTEIPAGETRAPSTLLEGARAEAAKTRERFELLKGLTTRIFNDVVLGLIFKEPTKETGAGA